MNQTEFEGKLAVKRGTPLFGDWLSKYQHVERMGHDEVCGLLVGDVYTQVKVDGANLTVAYDTEAGLIIASRNNVISVGGEPSTGFGGAIEFCLAHKGIMELAENYILRGEWTSRHSISYSKEYTNRFLVFDLQRYADMSYLHPNDYQAMLDDLGIEYIPTLSMHTNPDLGELVGLVDGPDQYGADQKEGIVIKNTDFKNGYGRTIWGKLVSADFKGMNKIAFGACKADPAEVRFASHVVSDESVLKVIHKVSDEHGKSDIRQMPEVLGRFWYDCFQEELWGFVKEKKVKAFNFRLAQNLIVNGVREIAISHYNGTLSLPTTKPTIMSSEEEDANNQQTRTT